MPHDTLGMDPGLTDGAPASCMRCCCCCLCPRIRVCFPAGYICAGGPTLGIPSVDCVGIEGSASSPAFCLTYCLTSNGGVVDLGDQQVATCACVFDMCDEEGGNCDWRFCPPGTPPQDCPQSPCVYIGSTTGTPNPPYGSTYYWFISGSQVCGNPLSPRGTSCITVVAEAFACGPGPNTPTDPTDCSAWISAPGPGQCLGYSTGFGNRAFVSPSLEDCVQSPGSGRSSPILNSDTSNLITSIECLGGGSCIPVPTPASVQVMQAPEDKPPGLLSQGLSFIKAAASHVRHGLPMVDDAEKQRRLAICETCPHYKGGKCMKCGCAMKTKAAWALSKCPIGKW